jgi:hypothetical protein
MRYDKDLKKIVSSIMDEPPIPAWFDDTWGKSTTKSMSAIKKELGYPKTDKSNSDVTLNEFTASSGRDLASNYYDLLGPWGGMPITSFQDTKRKHATLIESVERIWKYYRQNRANAKLNEFMYKFKRRRLPTIRETFHYIGAETGQSKDWLDGTVYSGAIYKKVFGLDTMFDGAPVVDTGTNQSDASEMNAIKLRRDVIWGYRREIYSSKGFLG